MLEPVDFLIFLIYHLKLQNNDALKKTEVPGTGVEPVRPKAQVFETSASTNSATPAIMVVILLKKLEVRKNYCQYICPVL